MKLKTLTAALVVAGLSASASAQVVDPIFGAAPNLTDGQEAAWSLAESIVSLVSATVTAKGCSGGGNFLITAQAGGTGNATYPTGGLPLPLNLTAVKSADVLGFGRQYTVTSPVGVAAFIPVAPVRNYTGTFTFGFGSAIMIASAVFEQQENGVWPMWDEHVIKDFWKDDCPVTNPACTGPFGKKANLVYDAGLEVITKMTYPKTKWRQSSVHIPPDGGVGVFEITKQLIQATNPGATCTVRMTGFSLADLTNPLIQGSVTVQ